MIPNENKSASYRCSECGFFTLPEGPTTQPVLQKPCPMCPNTTFVRDFTAAEMIELHCWLETWRTLGRPNPSPPDRKAAGS